MSTFRILSNWNEGSSDPEGNEGNGTLAVVGDTTWQHTFFDTEFWNMAGGDFTETATTTKSVGGVGVYVWNSTPEMVADVQSWLDDPQNNLGWIFVGNESASRTTKRFDSRHHPVPANRPSLYVEYELPCPWDLSGNGEVDETDLNLGAAAWPLAGGPEDIDGDLFVTVLDLVLIREAYGFCP